MLKEKINKLKKYLLLISILLLFITGLHLVYKYIYSNSEFIPVEGGNISEALIGDFPSLNPLLPLSGNNKYIISMLYRSMLRYDLDEKRIIGDIADCDISDYSNIKCYLKDNIKWSNGEILTSKDILATYNILKNTDVNPTISSLLSDSEIIDNGNEIIFKTNSKDINFLNIFFAPILSEATINQLNENELRGDFSPLSGIYSGKFKLNNIVNDSTLGITSIYLGKNEYYENNELMVDNLVLKIFSDSNQFLKHKETINIFNDKNSILGDSVPRFTSNKYSLPQYVGVFINYDKISDSTLRSFILNKIDRENLVKKLGEDYNKVVFNPFLTNTSIDNLEKGKNIDAVMKSKGYYKKSELIDSLIIEEKSKLKISSEAKDQEDEKSSSGIVLETGDKDEIKDESPIDDNTEKEIDYGGKSLTIVDPTYVDKNNFISQDNILLKGITDNGTTGVYINDYKLTKYFSGNKYFYYRLSESIGTLKQGKNEYKISFENKDGKYLKETIYFYFYRNKDKLNFELENYIKTKDGEKEQEETEEEIKAIEVTVTEDNTTDLNKEIIEENKKKIEEIEALEDHFYYDKDLNKYELNISYIDTEENIKETADYIKSSLETAGIKANINPITISELKKEISNEETENYDMIITGINLGYFPHNIYPYFHSSQVKNGFNFSNFKTNKLDIPLEELKSKNLTDEKIIELEEEILKVLKEEQIVKILYTPVLNNLVGKKIKDYILPDTLPEAEIRYEALDNVYINEKKIINSTGKGFKGFLKFLVNPDAK